MSIPPQEKEAARAALRAINPVSIRENVEYIVIIYRNGHGYGATRPISSGMNDGMCEPDILRAIQSKPKGSKYVAYGHTHGRDEQGYISLGFSPEDIALARKLGGNAYLATPNGELVMFDLSNPRAEYPRERL